MTITAAVVKWMQNLTNGWINERNFMWHREREKEERERARASGGYLQFYDSTIQKKQQQEKLYIRASVNETVVKLVVLS